MGNPNSVINEDASEATKGRPPWFSRLDLSHCQERFDETEAFAKKAGKLDDLHSKLSRLCHGDKSDEELTLWGRPAAIRVSLGSDFAPYSFTFYVEVQYEGEEEWKFQFNGGLIFHGSHDGGGDGSAPTFSVNMSPQDGWSIHT